MGDYSKLNEQNVSIGRLWEWHMASITSGIKRKLSFRQKIKNPWKIEVIEVIHRDVFIVWFKLIRDFKIQYGRTINVVRDKKTNIGKVYTITFTHFGALRYHMSEIGQNIKIKQDNFSRKNTIGNTATVVVDTEHPATVTFNASKSTVTFDLHYQVINKYGNVCL